MKKFYIITILLLMSILCISPCLITASADATTNIYYPAGISDYVDLNDISDFEIFEDKIFYTKDNLHVICYDKSTKKSVELVQNVNQGNIKNIQIAGEYLFVFSSLSKTFAYKISDLSPTEFSTAPAGFNIISAHYVDNKYYFAYINTKSGINSFNLIYYNSLSQSPIAINSSITFSSSIFNSKITLSDNLIAIKPMTGEKIYLIKDYTSASELTLLESNSGNYHEITGFDSSTEISDIAIINFNDGNYSNRIFIGYEGSSKTQICNFNGSKLTYEDDNNIISDKISVYNNMLYIYNIENADINICNYNPQTNELLKSQMFLAGKGSEEGRFKEVTELNFKSNVFYVTDSGNNRVQILSKNNIDAVDNINGTITEIVTDTSNNYYYAVYNSSSNSSTLYKNGQYLHNFSGSRIYSIAINLDNTLYLLSSTQIITFKSTSNFTSKNLSSLYPNDNSKIRISNNYTNNATPISGVVAESVFLLSINKTMYCLDPTTGKATTKTLSFDANIKDFKVNNTATNSPIFVLLENGDFVRTSLTEASDKNITLEGFDSYSCFSIDVINGDLHLYNSNLSAIEVYSNPDFCAKNNMVHYNINAYNFNGFNQLWQYTSIKSKALVYDYYNYAGNYVELGAVTNAIVLQVPMDSETGTLGEFAYIGYTYNNKLIFGYVQTSDLIDGIKPMALGETTYKLRTTNKNVQVYKYPSIFNDLTFYSFAQGDIITTYGKYISSIDNYEYYIVKIGEEFGYICSNDVVLSENTTKNIRTNASIKIYDGKEKINVYLTADENGSILYKLTDKYKINVENYNKNEKFTKITFVDEDQQEREGYVLTSYVKLAGISNTVLTAIILLVLDIIIAIIVIVFYHHYKKKQRENNKD